METAHVIHTNDEYIPDEQADIVEDVPTRGEVIMEDAPPPRQIALYRAYQTVWFILGLIETLLVFRFVLKMLGASTLSGFTSFIYATSYPFAAPFIGILPSSVSNASILEWSTLIAMVVYLVLAYGILEVIRLLTPVHTTQTRYTRKTHYAV